MIYFIKSIHCFLRFGIYFRYSFLLGIIDSSVIFPSLSFISELIIPLFTSRSILLNKFVTPFNLEIFDVSLTLKELMKITGVPSARQGKAQ